MNATTAIIPRQDAPALEPAAPINPMQMLGQAVERGMAIEVIEKLMTLAERWEANNARRAFDEAVAAAKAEIPPIERNRTGHNNKRYADFSAYARVIDPIIGKHGLSYRFRTVQDDKAIRVTCVLFKGGHYEETTLQGPADTSGNKNAIQAIGSTLTYLQRYSLTQALGLAASDDDDGKTGAGSATLSIDQIDAIRSLIVEVGADIQRFCKFMRVDGIQDIKAKDYQTAVTALESKRSAS